MDKIKIPTGEILYHSKLANGLSCFILPKAKFLRTFGILSTHYGSLDSSFKLVGEESAGQSFEVPPGIAHFLEHKLFEEEGGNVFSYFAKLGAQVNAFTSYDQTSYLFSTTENWEECLIQLIKFVNRPYLTTENVEKEKGIIIQELQMYADIPNHRIHTLLLENLYHEHPVRLDIGGSIESVQSITVDDLQRCYRTFYQPSNMALAIIGDLDPHQTLDLIKENYPAWQHPQGLIERIYPVEPVVIKNSKVEMEFHLSRPRYLLGFKHEPVWQKNNLLKQQIIMSIVMRLIAGRSSASYERLYGADLITDSFGASFSGNLNYAYSVLGSETRDPEALHAMLIDIIEDLKSKETPVTEVERIKKQLYGAYLASFDSFEYTANSLICHYFKGTPYLDYLDLLHKVTAADVQEALVELFDWDQAVIAILRAVNNHG